MSVTKQTTSVSYTAAGTSRIFAYPFRILDASHLRVKVDGVLQLSGYEVFGMGNPNGGNITFTNVPAAGTKIKIYRDIPIERSNDYTEGAMLRAETLDADFDSAVMMIQDLDQRVAEAAAGTSGGAGEFDSVAADDGTFANLYWQKAYGPIDPAAQIADNSIHGSKLKPGTFSSSIPRGPTLPSIAAEGDTFVLTTEGNIYVYHNLTWVKVGSVGGGGGGGGGGGPTDPGDNWVTFDDLTQDLQDAIKLIIGPADQAGTIANQMKTEQDARLAAINAERDARLAAAAALLGDLNTKIDTEKTERQTQDGYLAQRIDAVVAASGPGGPIAAISDLQTAMTTADTALATSISALDTRVGNNAASIASIQSAYTTADSALSSRVDTVSAKANSNEAAITAETTARTNADSSLASQITSLDSKYGNNVSVINTKLTALTDADTALSSRIDTLSAATTGGNAAAIQTEATTRATADSALSTRIDKITASSGAGSIAAAVQVETTARINADNALSSQITTVQSGIPGAVATATSQLTSRISTTEGKVTALESKYVVAVGAGDLIGGFVLANDSRSVTAAFDVNNFYIGSSTAKTKPFRISGNTTYLSEAVIANASIGTLKLAGNSVTVPVAQYIEGVVTGSTETQIAEVRVMVTQDDVSNGPVNLLISFGCHCYSNHHETLTMTLRGFRESSLVTGYIGGYFPTIFTAGGGAPETRMQGEGMEGGSLIYTATQEGVYLFRLHISSPGYMAWASRRYITALLAKR